MADGKIRPVSGKFFARATERTQIWNGIQQEITGTVLRKLAYEVTAVVRLYGNNITSADVRATLWVQAADFREEYIGIATYVLPYLSCNFHYLRLWTTHKGNSILPILIHHFPIFNLGIGMIVANDFVDLLLLLYTAFNPSSFFDNN